MHTSKPEGFHLNTNLRLILPKIGFVATSVLLGCCALTSAANEVLQNCSLTACCHPASGGARKRKICGLSKESFKNWNKMKFSLQGKSPKSGIIVEV